MSKKYTAKQNSKLSKRQVKKAAKKLLTQQSYGVSNNAPFYKLLNKA